MKKLNQEIKKNFWLQLLTSFITFFFITFFWTITGTYSNDYLNPYTLTFKNPKTVQMFNIIILYHYVMSFLIAIVVFTFLFIFLSFFRTYFFLHYKPKHKSQPITLAEVFSIRKAYKFIHLLRRWIGFNMLQQKFKHMPFYMKDIKVSLHDQTQHAPTLEFLWIVIPSLILVAIAYPSIMMLYYNEIYVDPVFNITAIGHQWYWTYEYNDFNLHEIFKKHLTHQNAIVFQTLDKWNLWFLSRNTSMNHDLLVARKKFDEKLISQIPKRISVDCNLITAKNPKFLRLLSTDQCLVIPAKTPIRLMVTSDDVIHSWAVPAYGIKIDAVPGRLNQQIINIPLVGTSWGQCSELCGVNHAYMPIEVKVLAFADFLFYMELRAREALEPYLVKIYRHRWRLIRNIIDNMIHGIKNEIPPLNTFGAFLYTLRFLRFSYVMFIVDAFPDKFAKDYSELHIYRPITTPRMMYLMTVEAYADINGREMPKALREEYDQMLNVFRRFSFKKYFDEHEKK